ncbi:MAG: hypothetical protein II986_09785 [Alistipes sp.]|nr:hypothetical protein [Alistipes sp.]
MKQKKNQQTIDSQEKKHSDNLIKQMMSQPCDLAALWGRAADSFPQNKRKQRIHIAIAVVVGVIIGTLAMYFLSSPERWIRL